MLVGYIHIPLRTMQTEAVETTTEYRRKPHLTYVRMLYCLIDTIFSQGLLYVLASLDTALGYVATNATKPPKFTL